MSDRPLSPMRSSQAVAQHNAGAARAPDSRTQGVGGFTRVGADANLVEGASAAAAQHRAQNARVVPRQNLVVTGRDRGIGGKHPLARESGAELDAPGTVRSEPHA